jgi:nucleoside-diphosphate-sugar epimerase
MREDREAYAQRTTDMVAIETGLEEHVKTYLIMSPTIYGHVDVVGDGTGAWDAVHIQDLAPLYELLLAKVLQGEYIPSGKEGIFFSETGDYTWMQLAEGLAKELHRQGILKTTDVKHLNLQEAAEQWGNGSIQYAELGFASK